MVDGRDRVSVQPVTASHHYPRHFVFEKGTLKHEFKSCSGFLLAHKFHIDDHYKR
jgi:hypothetical protein